MKPIIILSCSIASIMMSFAAATNSPNSGKWIRLGSREVTYHVDRDVIPVTFREGAFTAIRFVVKGGSLNMHRCVIHYENGETEEIEVRHNFTRGSGSRVIDLPGNKRFIEKIEFIYDTKNISPHRAVVTVWGRR